ncbi:MAG: DNA mismatch repair protein MutS [Tannerella sp.]|jgi:DNA mismatch repair protein MutS|nr:DNA mismatch repair protein MutS [Tannerella sp.]
MTKIIETPLMKQYFEIKSKHSDALLLFRVGDFYEMYGDDAVVGSAILGIVQTKRSNGAAMDVAMAGFPHHALDTYLPKLVRAGKRVAICDQLEDPKLAKKIVKRGVTELVTPGILINDNVLNTKDNNFLASVYLNKNVAGLALLDISTGEFLTSEGSFDYIDKLLNSLTPKEIVIERDQRSLFEQLFSTRALMTPLDDWIFNENTARERLLKQFETSTLKGFGVNELHNGLVASGAILCYLDFTQHNNISHITHISRIEQNNYVRLDNFTVNHLELLNPISAGGISLLDVIDKTSSPMGARLLKRWIVFPLIDVEAIKRRQEVVTFFMRSPESADSMDEYISKMGDFERIISKVAVGRVTPRELVQLKFALRFVEPVKKLCEDSGDSSLLQLSTGLELCENICKKIEREINPDTPAQIGKGNVIADKVNSELDEIRKLAHSGKDYLLKIQQRESDRTGIPSLKVAYNNVFGYFIEVRNMYKNKVPKDWIRKQTLVAAERYITEELKEYEEKILGAEEKILALETKIYAELVAETAKYITPIQKNAAIIAQIDCLLSFTKAAKLYRYICPIVDDSEIIDIKAGRHPVIERQLPVDSPYVANDVYLDPAKQQIIIITGPNMAGKSALLRQTALICLLAQMGSFVPAESAKIGIIDKIFTRVGASDNISLGESTFMVEMTEASEIINNLSPRSLVLFDELGRGTSTYDGISIAWAIVEYIHEHPVNRAKTLFATHYHELNEMERSFKRIRNFNVSVKEIDNRVIFIRKLVPGGSEHSFGIHVAKMAGMPKSIVKRAGEILKSLESENRQQQGAMLSKGVKKIASQAEGYQLNIFQLDDPVLSQVRDEIKHIDVNNLTPMEALNKLNEIKKIITG